MKYFFIICFCVVGINSLQGSEKNYQKKFYGDTLPRVFLGIGTGINNYTGMIGVGLDIKIIDRMYIRLGAGTGGWGLKGSVGIKHERKQKNGWTFSALYSLCNGVKNMKIQLETVSGQALIKKEVTLDFLQATTLTVSAGYNWFFKKKNKFFLEFGYAVPFEAEPYKVTDGSILSDTSKNLLKIQQPGGIVFGIGLMFGL